MLERASFWSIQHLHRWFRRGMFTKPRPTGRYLAVPEGVDVIPVLGRNSYSPNWEFSYNYRGEDVNLAQVVYDDVDDHEDVVWWQTHVRGWVHDDGRTWLRGHYEPEPTEHPSAHLEGWRVTNRNGLLNLKQALLEQGIDVTEEDYTRE